MFCENVFKLCTKFLTYVNIYYIYVSSKTHIDIKLIPFFFSLFHIGLSQRQGSDL